MSIETRIIKTIHSSPKDGLSAVEIWMKLHWWESLGLYPALIRLERKDVLRSAWVDGPYPRRRLYHMTKKGKEICILVS